MKTTAGLRAAFGRLRAAQRVATARMVACARDALRLGLAVSFAALLAACGGSDGSIDGPPPAAPAPAAPVARVEILSDGAWLPGNGQTRQLAAQAYDAAGNPVSATISWTSSRASQIAVDASGRMTSQVAAGSAQITAQADGVTSAPMLAYVATPAAGVVLVDDASIVGQPVETDPAATPSLANTYQVTLSGIAPPAVGTLLLGRGDKSLAGKVTAVTTTGAQTLATLQLVPLPELFAELEIEEILDLSRAEVLIPSDVEAQFNVARNGNTWSFTPRATPTTQRARPQNVTGTYSRDILPFRDCEASFADFETVTDLPIGFDPPSFSVTLDPTLDYVYSRSAGMTRFIVNAESKVEMSAALKAQAALSGGLNCKLQLFALRLPIGGPLAFFVGGYLPVGVGFELEASATLASFKLGAKAEAATKASLGWYCPPAGPECTFVRSMDDYSAKIEPLYEAPTLNGNLRLEAALKVFGYFEAELGNPFLRSLRFKAFEGQIGGKADGGFSTSAAQLRDLALVSKYSIALQGSAAAGIGAGNILRLLGFQTLTSLGLEFSVPLAESPQAQSVQADRASFAAGDTVNVKVALDPATLTFLPNIYNITTVQLRRRVGDVSEVLAAQTASTGQQEFEFAVTAPTAGDVSEWSAFVVTRLLEDELLSLSLGSPSPVGMSVLLTRGFVNSERDCRANAEENVDGPGDRYDSSSSTAEPATCRATAGSARAQGSASASASGPLQSDSAPAREVRSVSASGSASASASASVPADTSTGDWHGSAGASARADGTWELSVQGQAVTMTITGSVANAHFSAEWSPSRDGRGTFGTYRLTGTEDEGAYGPLSHSVRLEPGQTIRIRASTGARGGGVVDGDPATVDRPQSMSQNKDGSFGFTVRFDP